MRVHSSWHGIALAFLSPALLVGVGATALVGRSFHVVPALLVAGGVALGAVALLDFPTSTAFLPAGIERRALLRRERLAWSEVSELRRAGGSWLRRTPSSPDGEPRPGRPGGLVAVRRGRKYLLADQPESAQEYDTIVQRIRQWAPGVDVRATRPPDGLAPTWLYRPRRWRSSSQ